MKDKFHIPVMVAEVMGYLDIQKSLWYVDCNLGGGGHTREILKRGGKVLGIDLDQAAISKVSRKYKSNIDNGSLIVIQRNFSEIKNILTSFPQVKPMGILFDLGVSSYQLETPSRGFSFNMEGPLDMRMDQDLAVSAEDLINGLHEKELANLFWKLGEEIFAKSIARKIIEVREKKKIQNTNELANIILSVRKWSDSGKTHPATRVFQALRIAVNDELNSLKLALPNAFDVLTKNGRVVVISFHSLEDRIVKNFFNELVVSGRGKFLTKKPITPTKEEIEENPSSRSGKLRALQRIVD